MAGRRMGLPTGVEFIGKSIRIRFTVNGERRSETLAYPQTAKGIKAAADLRTQIISLANHGVLDEKRYAELLPVSSYTAPTSELMFGEYAQSWLDSLEVVQDTRSNYKGLMNNYWMPHLAALPIRAVTPMVLRGVVAKGDSPAPTVQLPTHLRHDVPHVRDESRIHCRSAWTFCPGTAGTYAKWLSSANDWSELEKLEMQLIGTELVQD